MEWEKSSGQANPEGLKLGGAPPRIEMWKCFQQRGGVIKVRHLRMALVSRTTKQQTAAFSKSEI